MSNLSRTPVQNRNTLDPRSYDSDDNSGELVDRLRQNEEILGVHVDLISRTPNHIRFDEAEPERASVPNQGTAAISAIPMETINLLLAQMVGMMQKFDDRLSAVTTIQHQMSSAMEDTICLSSNNRQVDERFEELHLQASRLNLTRQDFFHHSLSRQLIPKMKRRDQY